MNDNQVKGRIRNIAKEKNVSAQEILQIFLFERVIERLSKSKYKKNFILKGGFLISSMIGIGERTTMDIDTTVKGLPINEDNMIRIMKEILAIDVGDGVTFIFKGLEPIRDNDYNNYRVLFDARLGKINNPMKMDITTGDAITPSEIKYEYKSILDEKPISIFAYNLETILAEKFEAILQKGLANTRTRDFYDIYTLFNIYKNEINHTHLRDAINHTFVQRNLLEYLNRWEEIVDEIATDEYLIRQWEVYRKEYFYAKNISFDQTINALKEIGRIIE